MQQEDGLDTVIKEDGEKLIWQWYDFDNFTAQELYAILALRQQVFVVEQQCPYLDCDHLDQTARHLVGWQKHGKSHRPLAYLRLLAPGAKDDLPAIGRLLTHKELRGKGAGKKLLIQALEQTELLYPCFSVKISAQHYLVDFYMRFGFTPISDIYEEDGIPHITMIRPGLNQA